MPNSNELGEIAMELIADYPLYASTSNISYDEAIAVAQIFFGDDLRQAKKDLAESDDLMAEYFKTDRKHSLADYDKWVAEKKGAKK